MSKSSAITPLSNNYSVFTVSKISDNEIVLKGANDENVRLAPTILPKDIRVGDELVITIESVQDHQKRVNSTASMILDELLKDS